MTIQEQEEMARVAELWGLGQPIDVDAFLERSDIPPEVRDRVTDILDTADPNASNNEQADAYRLAQAQILIEVLELHRRRGGSAAVQ